jgi:hypothetical protein
MDRIDYSLSQIKIDEIHVMEKKGERMKNDKADFCILGSFDICEIAALIFLPEN